MDAPIEDAMVLESGMVITLLPDFREHHRRTTLEEMDREEAASREYMIVLDTDHLTFDSQTTHGRGCASSVWSEKNSSEPQVITDTRVTHVDRIIGTAHLP